MFYYPKLVLQIMKIRLLFIFLIMLSSAPLMAQKTMPNEYTFWDIKGDSIKLTDIKYKHTLTLVLYDPGCDHCWHQAKDIADNLKKFKKTKFVWISINTPKAIAEFKDKYFPGKMSQNMVFLHDPKMAIFKKFDNFTETPNLLIYDKDKKLIVALPKSLPEKIYPYYYKHH